MHIVSRARGFKTRHEMERYINMQYDETGDSSSDGDTSFYNIRDPSHLASLGRCVHQTPIEPAASAPLDPPVEPHRLCVRQVNHPQIIWLDV